MDAAKVVAPLATPRPSEVAVRAREAPPVAGAAKRPPRAVMPLAMPPAPPEMRAMPFFLVLAFNLEIFVCR